MVPGVGEKEGGGCGCKGIAGGVLGGNQSVSYLWWCTQWSTHVHTHAMSSGKATKT